MSRIAPDPWWLAEGRVWFKQAYRLAGHTQQRCAAELGVSQPSVGRWLKTGNPEGGDEVKINALRRYCQEHAPNHARHIDSADDDADAAAPRATSSKSGGVDSFDSPELQNQLAELERQIAELTGALRDLTAGKQDVLSAFQRRLGQP